MFHQLKCSDPQSIKEDAAQAEQENWDLEHGKPDDAIEEDEFEDEDEDDDEDEIEDDDLDDEE